MSPWAHGQGRRLGRWARGGIVMFGGDGAPVTLTNRQATSYEVGDPLLGGDAEYEEGKYLEDGSMSGKDTREASAACTNTAVGREIVLEFLVTVMYAFAVSGSIVAALEMTHEVLTAPALLFVALTHGLTYMALLSISREGHHERKATVMGYMNPILAFCVAFAKPNVKQRLPLAFAVMVVQSVATLLGVVLALVAFPGSLKPQVMVGAPQLYEQTHLFAGLTLEMLGTFLLAWVVMINHDQQGAPVYVGFAVTALQLFAFPFTGACLNPTRALACMLISWTASPNNVAHVVGPCLGAAAAVLARGIATRQYEKQ